MVDSDEPNTGHRGFDRLVCVTSIASTRNTPTDESIHDIFSCAHQAPQPVGHTGFRKLSTQVSHRDRDRALLREGARGTVGSPDATVPGAHWGTVRARSD
jgi:hypothetical protein